MVHIVAEQDARSLRSHTAAEAGHSAAVGKERVAAGEERTVAVGKEQAAAEGEHIVAADAVCIVGFEENAAGGKGLLRGLRSRRRGAPGFSSLCGFCNLCRRSRRAFCAV